MGGLLDDRADAETETLPLTFGDKVASWIGESRRDIERLKSRRRRTDTGHLPAAVGSHAALRLYAFAIEADTMRELGLGAPWPANWKSGKDMFAEYGAILAMTAKTWGKIGQEVFLLQGGDMRELEERNTAVGPSTMPHKNNPRYSREMVKLSRVVPREADVLLDWMVSIYERD